MPLQLYNYWRSSSSHRVRIALELKQLTYEYVPVHLVRGGGAQHAADHRARNPQRRVPVLVADGQLLTQSMAIIEWLDETHPQPPLLPADSLGRARVRSLAQLFIADVQPLQNLSVLDYLRGPLGADAAAVRAWLGEWIGRGLATCEARLTSESATGRYCHGNLPGMADVSLVPQLASARRFGVELAPYPTVMRIEAACMALPAFQRAAPEQQPDAEH